MSKTINVLLVEDDPMVREINISFIERVEGFKVVGWARTGEEAIEKIRQTPPASRHSRFIHARQGRSRDAAYHSAGGV